MVDLELMSELASDVADARREARSIALQTQDVGSANLDSVHVSVGGHCRIRRKSQRVERILRGSPIKTSLWNGYNITPPGPGQAAARTASAEHMVKVLRERGWEASVFYQVD